MRCPGLRTGSVAARMRGFFPRKDTLKRGLQTDCGRVYRCSEYAFQRGSKKGATMRTDGRAEMLLYSGGPFLLV